MTGIATQSPTDQGPAATAPAEPLVRIDGLSKRYKLYPRPSGRLVEWFSGGRLRRHEDFWALRDFSLRVGRGECVGVIGPNGAGKSTLLKIITGTLAPTSGSFNVRGRVLSLLELGTGFAPELTGRQNVIETASLLGLPRGHVDAHLPEIEEFAGLGEFMDRPIKLYSSGMYVRLAFSMFAFLEPDVFIVDEALAVGDLGFQRKCYHRLEQMLARGVTALVVSHDLAAIVKFCHRAVVLCGGRTVFEGPPRDACNVLNKIYFGEAAEQQVTNYGDGTATIEAIWFEDAAGRRITSIEARQPLAFCYTVLFHRDITDPVCGFHVKTLHGVEVVLASSDLLGHRLGHLGAGERLTLRWVMRPNLNAGSYFFGCGCRYPYEERFLARRVDAVRFPIVDVPTVSGLINPIEELRIQRTPADGPAPGGPAHG